MDKKIMLVAGARPNFMKIAPVLRAIEEKDGLDSVLVHTGQHYDDSMSHSFFKSLGIKKPDYNLEVGSGTHAVQTANIMVRFEDVCLKEKPNIILVVGDVNSTVAAGLVAKKLKIDLAHIEAGLRSRDRTMPEEINRLATDAITDLFFTTEKEANQNLLEEGQVSEKIHFVGHVMIDNLFYQKEKINTCDPAEFVGKIKKAMPRKYACMTLHRPSNVDDGDKLGRIIDAIAKIAKEAPVIFPCHPRTRNNIEKYGLRGKFKSYSNESKITSGIYITEPLGYNEFLYLWKDSAFMLTDSGGLQEETTALGIPCITIRENTERPITVEVGSNVLVGDDIEKIVKYSSKAIAGEWKECKIPELWDGKASERIVSILEKHLN